MPSEGSAWHASSALRTFCCCPIDACCGVCFVASSQGAAAKKYNFADVDFDGASKGAAPAAAPAASPPPAVPAPAASPTPAVDASKAAEVPLAMTDSAAILCRLSHARNERRSGPDLLSSPLSLDPYPSLILVLTSLPLFQAKAAEAKAAKKAAADKAAADKVCVCAWRAPVCCLPVHLSTCSDTIDARRHRKDVMTPSSASFK